MRLVDDFLLVTSDEDVAREFFCLVESGIPEFNCKFNRTKTQANFDVDDAEGDVWPDHNSQCLQDLCMTSPLCYVWIFCVKHFG